MARDREKDSAPVDVLAAEEFGVPAPDPLLRPEDLKLPPDLLPDEPHDVLAAEEFAMPSPEEAHKPASPRSKGKQAGAVVALSAIPVLALSLLRRARRRTSSGASESE